MILRGARPLGALSLVALAATAVAAREIEREVEKRVSPASPRAAARPTTTYWRVSFVARLSPADTPDAWVRLTLPLSDDRQAVLSRRTAAEGYEFVEEPTDENLFATWTWREGTEPGPVRLELLAETSDLWVPAPSAAYPPAPAGEKFARYLQATELVQSRDPAIRRRAQEIVRSARRLDEAAWALYQFTASFLKTDPDTSTLDALSVLHDERGTSAGKARLLAAFLRSLGIPARMVGGLRLKDASKMRSTISWVEAWLDGRWFPMDPANGHFGFVPNDHLVVYRSDLPLIVHRAGLVVEYDFLVRQVTRKSIFEPEAAGGGEALKPLEPPEVFAEKERVRTVATYVKKPVATVVMVTDENLPEAVVERMRAQARESEINLVLLIARFQSRYFRENYLQRLVATNLNVMREAHVLLVATRDEAGLFSLLELGEHRIRLNDARIVVTGSFPRFVGDVLGMVLYDLLDPGELALFGRRVDLLSLWEIARANLLQGTPIVDAARNWGVEASLIDEPRFESLSAYRKLVVRGWARAVRAQVPLQALTLILVLPFIAFLVVVFRNFVGIDTFGLFSPVIVSLAFLATGLYWGTLIFVVIVGLGACLRNVIQGLRLHLVARLAILVGLVSAMMTGLTVLGAYLGIGALLQVSLFPMVIMSNLIENFTASQLELGTRGAVRLTANTLFVCIACNLVVEGSGLPSLLLAFPELLLGVIALEVAAGKWRGLRLLEYKRFYDLLRRSRPEGRSRDERAA